MSLRDDVLAMVDLESEEVVVKQWGGKKFLVKSITAAQRYSMLEQCMDKSGTKIDGKRLYLLTAISCTYDPETGERVFTEADLTALSEKNSGAVDTLVQTANRLNGIGEVEVTELEKN